MNAPQGILSRGYQYPMAISHPTYYGEAWCSKNLNFLFQLKPKLLLVSETCVDTLYLYKLLPYRSLYNTLRHFLTEFLFDYRIPRG